MFSGHIKLVIFCPKVYIYRQKYHHNMTWVEKYRPASLKHVAGNPGAIKKLVSWVEGWKAGIPEKKAALLYGPPGTGKTSAAYALAGDMNYDIIELNASDTRTRDIVNRIVGSASTSGTLSPGKGKVITLDEVDGIHGRSDYGGLGALKNWIRGSHHPIVLIANDPWSLPREFRALCEMVEFRKIDQRTVLRILKDVCTKEGIETKERVLKIIATNSGGDLRSAINDLQSLTVGKEKLSTRDLDALKMRDSKIRIFDTLRMIFKTTSIDRAREAVFDSEEDQDTIMKWIVENLPLEYEDPEDLKAAFDCISRADVFMGRISKRQDWSLLKYVTDLMSAGVAMSKKETYKKFTRYQYPKTFIVYARTKKKRAIMGTVAEKMHEKCHGSKGLMEREFFPMFKIVFTKDPDMGANIASQMELNREEIQFFVGEEGPAKKIEKRAQDITAERIRGQLRSDKQVSLFEFGG
jgi:replication factor C large subunit